MAVNKNVTLKLTTTETVVLSDEASARYIAGLINDGQSVYTEAGYCVGDLGDVTTVYTAEVV